MKILVVTPDYPTNDNPVSGLFIRQQVQALAADGHDVAVLHLRRIARSNRFWNQARERPKDCIQNEEVYYARYFWPKWLVIQRWTPRILSRAISRSARSITSLPERILYAQWLLPTAEACIDLARAKALKFAAIARGYDIRDLILAEKRARLSRTLLAVPTLLGNGEWAGADLRQNGFHEAAKRLIVVRNIRRLPIRDMPFVPWRQSDELRVVCTAALEHKKGLDVLLKALARVKCRYSVSVFGAGSELESLRALASGLGIGELIQWQGRRPNGEVISALAKASLFIMPSRMEGVPNALIEAMGMGVPCIATKVNGIPELITDRESGLLIPPNSPDDLAYAIDWMHRSPERAQRMAENGHAHVLKLYDYSACLSHLTSVLEGANRLGPSAKQ